MTAVASSYGADQLADPVRLTDGYAAAFIGAAVVAAAGAVLAFATLRFRGTTVETSTAGDAREPTAA